MQSRRQGSKRAVTILGAAVAGLAALNWHLAETPIDISPISPDIKREENRSKQTTGLETKLDKKPAAQFREMVARPVFVPDRKPVQRRQPAANQTAAGLGSMRLIGVMRADNEPGRALIRMSSEETGKWFAEGEQFDGWRLRQVMARGVILESGGRSHELKMENVPPPTEAAAEPKAEPQGR